MVVAFVGFSGTVQAVELPNQPRNSSFGQVTLNCMVNPDRSLGDCQVVNESPEGRGFGDAALKAATEARLNARRNRQVKVGERIAFTKWYSLDEVGTGRRN